MEAGVGSVEPPLLWGIEVTESLGHTLEHNRKGRHEDEGDHHDRQPAKDEGVSQHGVSVARRCLTRPRGATGDVPLGFVLET